jgi:hypothetical protein
MASPNGGRQCHPSFEKGVSVPAAKRLRDLSEQVMATGGASRSDALRILPLSRELAEQRGELGVYPTVRFFADWSLHSKLDRASARSLLADLQGLVAAHWDGDMGEIVLGVSRLLSPYRLRDELVTLFGAASISTVLLGLPEPWTQFGSWILQDLLDKPIIGGPFTAEEEATGWGTVPRELRLFSDPEPGSQIKWQIGIGPRVQLVGDLKKV